MSQFAIVPYCRPVKVYPPEEVEVKRVPKPEIGSGVAFSVTMYGAYAHAAMEGICHILAVDWVVKVMEEETIWPHGPAIRFTFQLLRKAEVIPNE